MLILDTLILVLQSDFTSELFDLKYATVQTAAKAIQCVIEWNCVCVCVCALFRLYCPSLRTNYPINNSIYLIDSTSIFLLSQILILDKAQQTSRTSKQKAWPSLLIIFRVISFCREI